MDEANVLERAHYLDKSIDLYIGDIIEYDMSDGGFSIIKEEHLVPDDVIESLAKLPKGFKRNDAVGKLQYDKRFKGFGKLLESKFTKYRIIFGELNELSNNDILSIKRDAVFTKRFCFNTSVGQNINFKEKNLYSAYMNIHKYEIYWKSDGHIDVKGITDEKLKLHENGLIKIIWEFMRYLVSFDDEGAKRYIVSIIDKYRFHELDVECYRAFDTKSMYHVSAYGSMLELTDMGASMLPTCNISYNFTNILVPMLNLVTS